MSASVTYHTYLLVALAWLGSPSFREREVSHAVLAQSLPMSVPYLEAARQGDDVEASHRAASILGKWHRDTAGEKAAVALPTDYPRMPWLHFPADDIWRDSKMGHYLTRAQGVSHKGPPDWPEYRKATKFYITDLYSDMRTADTVQAELDRMRDAEISWIQKNGNRYNPPLTIPE